MEKDGLTTIRLPNLRSLLHVPSPTTRRRTYGLRSMKNLIQSENNFFQSINRLEAQMSHLINIEEKSEVMKSIEGMIESQE